eukprot:234389_1
MGNRKSQNVNDHGNDNISDEKKDVVDQKKVIKYHDKPPKNTTQTDAIIQKEFKIYVGVDFGTDGTGLAYALPTGDVYIHQKWKGYKRSTTTKPKTCILLDANSKFLAFGQPAINSYITMGGEKTGWMLFENFKMALYTNDGSGQLTA